MENSKLQMQQAITSKAITDTNFKRDLMASPQETLSSIGYKVSNPNNKTFKVVDQTDTNTVFINIPATPNSGDMELSDALLEIVAGGAASVKNGAGCAVVITAGGDVNVNDIKIG